MEPPAQSSQASSHFSLEPISADILAVNELARRNEARAFGLVKCGCGELDDYVLRGGLERGGVVGVSAEDEGVGLLLSLQMLAHGLREGSLGRAMVVTAKPATWIAGGLRDALRRESDRRAIEGEDGDDADDEQQPRKVNQSMKQYLDRVMLSQVFDLDGLWEVLAELDEPDGQSEGTEQDANVTSEEGGEHKEQPAMEIKDSQDEDDSPVPTPSAQLASGTAQAAGRDEAQGRPRKQQESPSFILITHFSTLLTSLFTQREKSAAHSLLQLLSSRLRYLARALPSQPLIMLLNSTTTAATSDAKLLLQHQQQQLENKKRGRGPGDGDMEKNRRRLDPTLRSVFSPPDIPGAQSYVSRAASEFLRRSKPSFGMIFAQMLDVHLLCTRGEDDGSSGGGAVQEDITVVEVLLDELGIWEGSLGRRKDREQRWGAVRVAGGRLVNGVEEERRRPQDVRIVAGFGGPRV